MRAEEAALRPKRSRKPRAEAEVALKPRLLPKLEAKAEEPAEEEKSEVTSPPGEEA